MANNDNLSGIDAELERALARKQEDGTTGLGRVGASTSLLPKMARTYREYGRHQEAIGNQSAAAAGLTAADALEDVADLRAALTEALRIADLANGSASGFDSDRDARIAELRAKFLGGM